MLLRHRKEESFSLNVMKGKSWCMLWLWLILGKYLAANVKKGYSQVGNELLHEVGSSWIVKVAQKDTPVSLSNFFALLLILNRIGSIQLAHSGGAIQTGFNDYVIGHALTCLR